MAEYIDKDRLRLMKTEECAGHTIEYAMGWKACVEWVKSLPAADVRENVVGEWIQHYETTSDNETLPYGWECSLCGRWEMEKQPFCNCGAQMLDVTDINVGEFAKDTDVPSKSAERYPLPITCGECGHTMRPVHKHMVPDMPRTYFCTFCGAGFHEDDPRIRFREKWTNADRIRAMSDEELAKLLQVTGMQCPDGHFVGDYDCDRKTGCFPCWLDWLKSPAKTLQEEE